MEKIYANANDDMELSNSLSTSTSTSTSSTSQLEESGSAVEHVRTTRTLSRTPKPQPEDTTTPSLDIFKTYQQQQSPDTNTVNNHNNEHKNTQDKDRNNCNNSTSNNNNNNYVTYSGKDNYIKSCNQSNNSNMHNNNNNLINSISSNYGSSIDWDRQYQELLQDSDYSKLCQLVNTFNEVVKTYAQNLIIRDIIPNDQSFNSNLNSNSSHQSQIHQYKAKGIIFKQIKGRGNNSNGSTPKELKSINHLQEITGGYGTPLLVLIDYLGYRIQAQAVPFDYHNNQNNNINNNNINQNNNSNNSNNSNSNNSNCNSNSSSNQSNYETMFLCKGQYYRPELISNHRSPSDITQVDVIKAIHACAKTFSTFTYIIHGGDNTNDNDKEKSKLITSAIISNHHFGGQITMDKLITSGIFSPKQEANEQKLGDDGIEVGEKLDQTTIYKSKLFQLENIINYIHCCGINIRYLFYLASLLPKQDIYLKTLILTEVVARVLQFYIKEEMRDKKNLKYLIGVTFSRILEHGTYDKFWIENNGVWGSASLKHIIIKYLPIIRNPDTQYANFKKEILESNSNLKFQIDLKLLILRLKEMFNIIFREDAEFQFLEYSYRITENDIESIEPVIKYPNVVMLKEGMAIMNEISKATKEKKKSFYEMCSMLNNAIECLRKARKGVPSSLIIATSLVRCYLLKSELVTNQRECCELLKQALGIIYSITYEKDPHLILLLAVIELKLKIHFNFSIQPANNLDKSYELFTDRLRDASMLFKSQDLDVCVLTMVSRLFMVGGSGKDKQIYALEKKKLQELNALILMNDHYIRNKVQSVNPCIDDCIRSIPHIQYQITGSNGEESEAQVFSKLFKHLISVRELNLSGDITTILIPQYVLNKLTSVIIDSHGVTFPLDLLSHLQLCTNLSLLNQRKSEVIDSIVKNDQLCRTLTSLTLQFQDTTVHPTSPIIKQYREKIHNMFPNQEKSNTDPLINNNNNNNNINNRSQSMSASLGDMNLNDTTTIDQDIFHLISSCKQLRELSISNKNITDNAFIRKLDSTLTTNTGPVQQQKVELCIPKKLQLLSLSNCVQLTDKLFFSLSKHLTCLTSLDLSKTKVANNIIDRLWQLPLQHLNLASCEKISTSNLIRDCIHRESPERKINLKSLQMPTYGGFDMKTLIEQFFNPTNHHDHNQQHNRQLIVDQLVSIGLPHQMDIYFTKQLQLVNVKSLYLYNCTVCSELPKLFNSFPSLECLSFDNVNFQRQIVFSQYQRSQDKVVEDKTNVFQEIDRHVVVLAGLKELQIQVNLNVSSRSLSNSDNSNTTNNFRITKKILNVCLHLGKLGITQSCIVKEDWESLYKSHSFINLVKL